MTTKTEQDVSEEYALGYFNGKEENIKTIDILRRENEQLERERLACCDCPHIRTEKQIDELKIALEKSEQRFEQLKKKIKNKRPYSATTIRIKEVLELLEQVKHNKEV